MAVTSNVSTPASASRRIASSASMPGASRRPAVPDGDAVADVDRDGDPRRSVGLDQATGERRVLERGSPDDGSRGPGGECLGDGALVRRPPATSTPMPLPTACDDRRDRDGMRRDARSGSVEVDDVDPSRPRRGELSGDRRWIAP